MSKKPSRTLKPTPMGQRLRRAREKGGISARNLCLLAGVTTSVGGMVERGYIHRPTVDVIARLVVPLGISLDWLVLGRGPEPRAEDIRSALAEAGADLAPTTEAAA